METLLSMCVGLGLAAACGFRVFVPLLVLSIGARAGMVNMGEDWSWVGSTPALIALGVATVLEVGGYWIPWVDHVLDVVASPAAVVAGSVAAASQMAEFHPLLQWSAAIIAGGGIAAAVQGVTVAVRAGSTATTGGLANPAVSTGETALAGVVSVSAVVAPVVVIVLFACGVYGVVRYFRTPADRRTWRQLLPIRVRAS
ncbi:MAG: DUF4126 domain-containing protein [Phycisphaeraceae bacterium]|nr:DUF4126 domain-containing protein [Phycisphaeraceae bacterium]